MLYDVFVAHFQVFIIVFMRITGLFISAPFYSGAAMPMRFKLALTFFVALISTPLVVGMGIKTPPDLASLGVSMVSNFVFGAGIGFFVFIVIAAFQVSAQIFSMQMGLGMNEVFDPISDTQVPALGNILAIMITLLFLRMDGQFFLVQIMVDSFRAVNLITQNTAGILVQGLLSALAAMLDIALKLALPIIGVSLVMDIAMGMISRVAPQFNVMIMGFNIKLLAGFLVLWLVLPPAVDLGGSVVTHMLDNVSGWVGHMKPQ